MKLKKTKFVGFIGLMSLAVQLLFVPTVVKAADSAHYELKGWKMGVVGDSAGINFGYIGSDGASLVSALPIDPSLVAGHGNDPSWNQYDSVAPLLAYIKKYGVDNNIQESMNPTCFDPSIFKALAAQGVNLNQLGGPNVPPGLTPPDDLVGKANYGGNIDKVLVGVGVPAPDLSSISGTTNKSTSINTPTPTSVETADPTPAPTPKVIETAATTSAPTPKVVATAAPTPASATTPKTATSTPKVGTELNPVPQAQEPAIASKADPQRTDPPIMAMEDKTQTKIEPPIAKNNESNKSTWTWSTYAEIAGAGILFLALIAFVYFRYIKGVETTF